MPSRRENSGFQSSAGLMRYFDTENDKGLRLSPTAVIGIAIALIAVVLLLGVFFPLSDRFRTLQKNSPAAVAPRY